MIAYAFRLTLLLAAGLACQLAVAKPVPPSGAETFAGQAAFNAVAASGEFVEATRRGDWDTAKSLMARQGIYPDSQFIAIVCPPPYHVYYSWQWALVGGSYVLTWQPKGCIKAVKYQGGYYGFHE